MEDIRRLILFADNYFRGLNCDHPHEGPGLLTVLFRVRAFCPMHRLVSVRAQAAGRGWSTFKVE
jgi:hypothetical protein